MKVLLVHNRYRSTSPSGEDAVVDQEGEALAALGHEIIRFERRSDDIQGWPKAKKASLPVRILWSREVYRDLTAILRERQPDVVHVHNTFPLLSPAVLYACRDEAIPVVATIHNKRLICASGDFFRNGSVCHDCAHSPAAQAIVHGCYRNSRAATALLVMTDSAHRHAWRSLISAYIFVSASQRDMLSKLDLPERRIFVKHHVVPRCSVPQEVHKSTVMYVGRLDQGKGLHVLMAGWDSYLRWSRNPGLRLLIAGGGPLQNEVADWALARPSVDMVGFISSGRRTELMSKARAVVLPSVLEETFGLVAVEAMAAGAPPIATAHGSFTELITSGVDGTLLPPGDPTALALALADVDQHPSRYQAYGNQARKTYEERFSPERSLDQLLEIYRFAIADPVNQSRKRDGSDPNPRVSR